MADEAMPPAGSSDLDYAEILKKSWTVFTTYPGQLIAGMLACVLMTPLIIPAGSAWVGYCRLVLKAAKGEDPEYADAFSGFSQFVPAFTAWILIFIIVVIGLALVVVPGIVAAILLGMTFFYLADDEDCTSAEAMKASYALVKENIAPFIIILIIAIVPFIIVLFVGIRLNPAGNYLLIGSLIVGPIVMVMYAIVFDTLKGTVPDNPHHAPMP